MLQQGAGKGPMNKTGRLSGTVCTAPPLHDLCPAHLRAEKKQRLGRGIPVGSKICQDAPPIWFPLRCSVAPSASSCHTFQRLLPLHPLPFACLLLTHAFPFLFGRIRGLDRARGQTRQGGSAGLRGAMAGPHVQRGSGPGSLSGGALRCMDGPAFVPHPTPPTPSGKAMQRIPPPAVFTLDGPVLGVDRPRQTETSFNGG